MKIYCLVIVLTGGQTNSIPSTTSSGVNNTVDVSNTVYGYMAYSGVQSLYEGLVCTVQYIKECGVQVLWAQQQVARRRVKRGAFYMFSDPKWPRMWYLVSSVVFLRL